MQDLRIKCIITFKFIHFYMQSLGQKIKLLRERKGVKQETVAQILEISQSNYSRIESEDTEDLPYSKIKKILTAINASMGELEGEKSITNGNNSTVNNNINNSQINEIKLIEKLLESHEREAATKNKLLCLYKEKIAKLERGK